MGVYGMAWRILSPVLRRHNRLAEGWDQRWLHPPLPRADLWLQAASAGEAYLAREIIDRLTPSAAIRVLVTTNTRQGLDILSRVPPNRHASLSNMIVSARYFPFDHPALMTSAVASVCPRLVGLLETELWPGLLAACRATETPTVVINGRINLSSLRRYRVWPALWQAIAPTRILAISSSDAHRFNSLFPKTSISVMNNVKFDQWARDVGNINADRLKRYFIPDPLLAVFGSIRQAEETAVQQMVSRIRSRIPGAIIALFPRHMDRMDRWRNYLTHHQFPWCDRSRLDGTALPGHIVLWDRFGELRDAYQLATTAFVGGSLAPLGGQNFLEPLGCGVTPVIGPSWHNFAWVGEQIFKDKLVHRASGWESAADYMINAMKNPIPRSDILQRVKRFAQSHTGGTRQACRTIESYLNTGKP
jgi:3-deoxy-D-manno-octulosonic-acid transferase